MIFKRIINQSGGDHLVAIRIGNRLGELDVSVDLIVAHGGEFARQRIEGLVSVFGDRAPN
jgi:hypothetical protein